MTDTPLGSEHRIDPALGIVLSLITCGLYNVYWNYRQFKAFNALLGREEFHFAQWLILSIVTCGLYHVYSEYRQGAELYAWLKAHGREPSNNLPYVGLLLSCLGLTIVADAVYQHELNKLIG